MVIGERFAWGHMPKTGGDATLAYFRVFPELIVHSDDSSVQAKHDPFSAREAQIGGKLLVLNIRRLPAWMLSHAQHEARDGIYPTYEPTPMPTAGEISERTLADDSLNYFTSNGRFSVGRWLRAEDLADDFLAFIRDFTDVSEQSEKQVRDTGMINAIPYDHEVRSWFDDAQIDRMYARNPLWASIEREVYNERWNEVRQRAEPALREEGS